MQHQPNENAQIPVSSGNATTVRKRRMPLALLIIYGSILPTAVIYFAFRYSTPFADWFNCTVGAVFRRLLAQATMLFPFSLAETLLAASPLLLALLIFIGIRYHTVALRDTLIYCGSILAIAVIVLQLFVYAFAPGYYARGVDERLGLVRRDVSAEELYEAALLLIEEINAGNDVIYYGEDGFSILPYTHYEMNDRLIAAYRVLPESYPMLESITQNFYSVVKPVMLSEPMTYTHISGVYTFFTGEANLNMNFPAYSLPFTAAHELAHQRGVAREDEANFIAYLVCTSSNDPYIRYSGYLQMYEYVASALSRANRELYRKARAELEPIVIKELQAYAAFFAKYQDSKVGEVSGAVNNAYLESLGTPGTASYGMVVDLTVALFKKQGEIEG